MKIAFVKSIYYPDLYQYRNTGNVSDVIFSSSMRSGPISLFTEYETDFFIIKDDDGMNNLTWKEKIAFCRQGSIEDYIQLSKNTRFYNNEEISNVRFSISANEINWEEYEIVICLDACVSDTVTKKFSNVTWCYYISEGCMPEAKNSRIKALDGYDYFLNQRFRFDLDYIRDPNLEHEVDFPYHLNSPKSMRKLLGKESFSNKSGIFVDKDTRPLLSSEQVNALEKFGPVRFTGGTIDVVLRELAASKYYLRLGDKPIWGNASIEAAACEALQINSPRGFNNRIFCLPDNTTSQVEFSDLQFKEAVNILEKFESEPDSYIKVNAELSNLCHEICFIKPISRIISSSKVNR